MRRVAGSASIISFLFAVLALSGAAVNQQYTLTIDPQALAIAQASFNAMGGVPALAGYQDSSASGTITVYSGGTSASYPITIKSKGLRETRVELQKTNGTNVRIVNQGVGAIIKPDGSLKSLYSNNTFHEHVNHIPLMSVLAEFANGNVNLLYKGTAQVQNQPEDVVEIDFVPNLANGAAFASMSGTLFFINQSTKLVDKIQRSTFYEHDDKNTFKEETYFTDYRPIDGMLVPYHLSTFVDGQPNTDVVFTSVQLNVGLLDTAFSLPQGGN